MRCKTSLDLVLSPCTPSGEKVHGLWAWDYHYRYYGCILSCSKLCTANNDSIDNKTLYRKIYWRVERSFFEYQLRWLWCAVHKYPTNWSVIHEATWVHINADCQCSYSEKSPGMVVILPLIHIGDLWLTFSSLKKLIFDETRQNGYQTVPFSLYIHNRMFVFILE